MVMNMMDTFVTKTPRGVQVVTTAPHKTAVSVRLANLADAGRIAHISRRGFAAAHEQAFADADLTRYLSASFKPRQIVAEMGAAHALFLVAEADGAVVGTLRLSHTVPPDSIHLPLSLELSRLYLEPQWAGRGVGSALMGYALRTALVSERKSCWLAVWEGNDRAINFYQRWGFQQVGIDILPVGASCPTGLVMARWF